MPINRHVRGTGITAEQRETISQPIGEEESAAIERMIERANDGVYDFDTFASRLSTKAASVLEAAGLPGEGVALHILSDGSCRPLSEGQPWPQLREGERIKDLVMETERRHGWDSAEGYAARFLRELRLLRVAIERGEMQRALLDAVRLGSLIREADLKSLWEKPAIAGRASIVGGRSGAAEKSARIAERNVSMAREYLEGRSKAPAGMASSTFRKQEIGRRHGLKKSAAVVAIDHGLEIIRQAPKPD